MAARRNVSTKAHASRAARRRERLEEAIATLEYKLDMNNLSGALDHALIAAYHEGALDAEIDAASAHRSSQDSALHARFERATERLKATLLHSSPYRNPRLDLLAHRLQP